MLSQDAEERSIERERAQEHAREIERDLETRLILLQFVVNEAFES